jgi:colanic acid/amylovoran biosynthesis protein
MTGFAREIRRADMVVCTGGGFMNDVFFTRHAAGVLATLAAAQQLGRPTAMFGQGIGPLRRSWNVQRAEEVLERLRALGLRSAELGPFASVLESAHNWEVTGDDALSVAGVEQPAAQGVAIGLNVRPRLYAGVGFVELNKVRAAIREVATVLSASVAAIPIAINQEASDFDAIAAIAPSVRDSAPPENTADLRRSVATCRIVITCSYHAAVFALARGIPIVALSCTDYYSTKFAGLSALFPDGAVTRLDLRADHGPSIVAGAVAAWNTKESKRDEMVRAAREMVERSRVLWESFHADVESYNWARNALGGRRI